MQITGRDTKSMMNTTFKNYNDLYFDVLDWSVSLPRDFDTVIGIPRSGLIIALMLSQIRNIRVGSVQSLLSGEYEYGHRVIPGIEKEPKKILVVDDTLKRCRTLFKVKRALLNFDNISYGAVYISPGKESYVDYYYKILESPRPFLWNVFHSLYLDKMCVDIDGVLCVDPTPEENDDGVNYRKFILNAQPVYIPTCPIHSIVTSRLEKYRTLTEKWLKRYNIKYKNLIMSPYNNATERRVANDYGEKKAEYYIRTGVETELFIESSLYEAWVIRVLSGKPVLYTGTMELV